MFPSSEISKIPTPNPHMEILLEKKYYLIIGKESLSETSYKKYEGWNDWMSTSFSVLTVQHERLKFDPQYDRSYAWFRKK